MSNVRTARVAVIGGGPGGYAAAFAAADLGLDVVLVSDEPPLGGTCLNRGCIPSKALLHVAKVIRDARQARTFGVTFSEPSVDLAALRAHVGQVVSRMAGGLSHLAAQRGVEVVHGRARFTNSRELEILRPGGERELLRFQEAVVATGSRPAELVEVPAGSPPGDGLHEGAGAGRGSQEASGSSGGYIGLELATVYAALGSRVSVVEMADTLLPGFDRDLVRPLMARLKRELHQVLLKTRVTSVEDDGEAVRVRFAGEHAPQDEEVFDRVLVAVGRRPNTEGLGLENTGVRVDPAGFIQVDAQRRTADPAVFAVGDVAGPPMLAHKAADEGKLVAEVLAGRSVAFDARAIPAVVYTDPEIAACGLSEEQAKAEGRNVKVVRFPWAASGRAAASGLSEGMTKLIVDADSEVVLGVGIVGSGASELIAEGALAVEMGATAEDLRLTVHPHPTLSETVMEAAEAFYGMATHIYRKS